jgi:hypothetical protein
MPLSALQCKIAWRRCMHYSADFVTMRAREKREKAIGVNYDKTMTSFD